MINGQKDVILHTFVPYFCHQITMNLSKNYRTLLQHVNRAVIPHFRGQLERPLSGQSIKKW